MGVLDLLGPIIIEAHPSLMRRNSSKKWKPNIMGMMLMGNCQDCGYYYKNQYRLMRKNRSVNDHCYHPAADHPSFHCSGRVGRPLNRGKPCFNEIAFFEELEEKYIDNLDTKTL